MTSFLINPYRFGAAYDTDAQTYITAVETADGQTLETGVRDAINAFVVGCKADSIWTAIKASCILAGARTLSGALVPLVGTAPTNNNFVSGDYNRKTGLNGNGSSKYLSSNRNANADPQNSHHLAVFISSHANDADNSNNTYLGTNWDLTGSTHLGRSGSTARVGYLQSRSSVGVAITDTTAKTGFHGIARSSSTGFAFRYLSTTTNYSQTSQTPRNEIIAVFRNGAGTSYAATRLAFYSIGESLDLALLDSRVSTLISALAAAIP